MCFLTLPLKKSVNIVGTRFCRVIQIVSTICIQSFCKHFRNIFSKYWIYSIVQKAYTYDFFQTPLLLLYCYFYKKIVWTILRENLALHNASWENFSVGRTDRNLQSTYSRTTYIFNFAEPHSGRSSRYFSVDGSLYRGLVC